MDIELHPSIMDGALQTVACLHLSKFHENMYLPFSMGEMEMVDHLEGNCYVYVRAVDTTRKDISIYNLDICDKSGNMLIKLRDFAIKAVHIAKSSETEKVVMSANEKKGKSYFIINIHGKIQ